MDRISSSSSVAEKLGIAMLLGDAAGDRIWGIADVVGLVDFFFVLVPGVVGMDGSFVLFAIPPGDLCRDFFFFVFDLGALDGEDIIVLDVVLPGD